MFASCECTLSRLLPEQEVGRVNQLLKHNGGQRVDGSLLAQIERFSTRRGCPYLHRLDDETGYCSCEEFILDWTAELGETAGLKDGRPL